MHLITGKHIERRTFLRGMGATVALPLLDAMIPAGRSWRRFTADPNFTRLICVEESMGAAGCSDWGDARHLFEVWRGAPAGYAGKYPGRIRATLDFLKPVGGTYHDNFMMSDPMPELGDWLDFAFRRIPVLFKKRQAHLETQGVELAAQLPNSRSEV